MSNCDRSGSTNAPRLRNVEFDVGNCSNDLLAIRSRAISCKRASSSAAVVAAFAGKAATPAKASARQRQHSQLTINYVFVAFLLPSSSSHGARRGRYGQERRCPFHKASSTISSEGLLHTRSAVQALKSTALSRFSSQSAPDTLALVRFARSFVPLCKCARNLKNVLEAWYGLDTVRAHNPTFSGAP